MSAPTPLTVAGSADADELLRGDPFALLVGMLLDQQVPLEWAFAAPATLWARLGGDVTPSRIAAMDPEALVEVFVAKPALHRYPAAMARRAHALATLLVQEWDGDAAAVWRGAASGAELKQRIRALPGFGDEKAKILVALLAKRFGIRPDGWDAAAAPFSDGEPRSVADCGSLEDLARVKAWKATMRAAGRGKQEDPA